MIKIIMIMTIISGMIGCTIQPQYVTPPGNSEGPPVDPAPSSNNKLYIVMGQSNADGRGSVSQLSTAMKAPITRANVWWGTPKQWQQLDAGTNANYSNSTLRCGPIIPIAYYQSIKYPSSTLYFISFGIGGSSLHTGWEGGVGANYLGMIAAYNAAKVGLTFDTIDIIWYQGETDSGLTAEIADAYQANESDMIASLNSDIPGIDNIITVNIATTNVYNSTVRAAKVANAGLGKYTLVDSGVYNPTNIIHLTTSMIVQLGEDISDLL